MKETVIDRMKKYFLIPILRISGLCIWENVFAMMKSVISEVGFLGNTPKNKRSNEYSLPL